MWKRFVRAIKSIFGGLVSSMEDPKLILEQNIRELNDQVPKMNENIATVKANVMLLKKEVERYEKQLTEVTSKIRAAINANRDDIAENYALQLQKLQDSLSSSKQQLDYAEKAYDKALQVKKAFIREKDRKIQEAREALRAHERAAWQAKVADTLEQFEVGGIDATHNEMINKINEQTAKNEARMEIALDSVDTKTMEIEIDAEKLRAHDLVQQFKLEMMQIEGGSEGGAKTGGIKVDDELDSSGSKSVGRNRTKA
jgi:phage shock protein A